MNPRPPHLHHLRLNRQKPTSASQTRKPFQPGTKLQSPAVHRLNRQITAGLQLERPRTPVGKPTTRPGGHPTRDINKTAARQIRRITFNADLTTIHSRGLVQWSPTGRPVVDNLTGRTDQRTSAQCYHPATRIGWRKLSSASFIEQFSNAWRKIVREQRDRPPRRDQPSVNSHGGSFQRNRSFDRSFQHHILRNMDVPIRIAHSQSGPAPVTQKPRLHHHRRNPVVAKRKWITRQRRTKSIRRPHIHGVTYHDPRRGGRYQWIHRPARHQLLHFKA